MRRNIVHIGAKELEYEIRQVVEIAKQVELLSQKEIYWENIGDPVEKGEKIPQWMKDIIKEAVNKDSSYAYSPTAGLTRTREYLAERNNAQGGVQIEADDIIFFNGLGDAINKIYYLLRREARVIGPSPSYPTHSSAEAGHAASPPITYRLMPENNWMPDLEELEMKIKYNENIAGIMIINPDNPTGAVFPREVVREMLSLARQYDLFIVADEIYMNMVYGDLDSYSPMTNLIEDLPVISLQGISKEFPWPGSRCGWMEIYNRKKDLNFNRYIQSIFHAKMLEVCSTTLPQTVLPDILSHPQYSTWQSTRNDFFKKRSEQIQEIFADCPNVIVNSPGGAFYVSVVFKEETKKEMSLKIENSQLREYIQKLLLEEHRGDFSFVYQLLGAKNICLVPLSSFVTELQGFRCTLLERDDAKFEYIYRSIVDAIKEFFQL